VDGEIAALTCPQKQSAVQYCAVRNNSNYNVSTDPPKSYAPESYAPEWYVLESHVVKSHATIVSKLARNTLVRISKPVTRTLEVITDATLTTQRLVAVLGALSSPETPYKHRSRART
jgi:hypothetical protein